MLTMEYLGTWYTSQHDIVKKLSFYGPEKSVLKMGPDKTSDISVSILHVR